MEYLDLIGIGAINFDYIFFCKKFDDLKTKYPEIGAENLNKDRKNIYNNLKKLLYNTKHTEQIGGSSFFAVKSAKAVTQDLKVGYVGVCGNPQELKNDFEFCLDLNNEFNFLSSKEWLFFDDGNPGIALVYLNKGIRHHIDINAGVNDKLQRYVTEHENEKGDNSFAMYLANSKWIHLTSLSQFDQFRFFIEKIKQAKELNPQIKISVDPGSEYVKDKQLDLHEVFSIADYVFFNESEFKDFIGGNNLPENISYEVISSAFNKYHLSNTKVIVIKGKAKNMLISFKDGEMYISHYWHKKLSTSIIKNDTGSGDAFAGGFIASLLSSQLLIHQPTPISVGAIAASARLKTETDSPFSRIAQDTNTYMAKIRAVEANACKQKIKFNIRNIKNDISSYIAGIVTGIIASIIATIILNVLGIS